MREPPAQAPVARVGSWRWALAQPARRPALLAGACLLIAALSIAGLARLRLDDDYRAFLDRDDPALKALEAFERVYSHTEQVLLVVVPEGGSVFTPAVLAAVAELTEAAWRLPFAQRVDSLSNFQRILARGDELEVRPLVEPGVPIDASAARALRELALAEPALRRRLVSERGDVTAVAVRFGFDGAPAGYSEIVDQAARALAARFAAEHPGIELRLTGNVLLDAAFPKATRADLETLVPVMYLVIGVVMALLLRSLAAALLTLAVVGLAAATALGWAGWLGIPITAASADAPTIIMTLAVADCIHILSRYLGERGAGCPPEAALERSLALTAVPVTLTSLTTLVGFLSLNFSDSPAFRGLGNITAVGVAAAYLYAVVLLPAALAWSGHRITGSGRRRALPRYRGLARWVIGQRRAVLVVAAVAVAGAAAALPGLRLNDRFVDYFDESVPFRRDTEFTMERLTGIYRIHYSLPAGGADGIHEPAYLERVEAFARWLRAQPGVVHVDALTDLLKRLNRGFHGDDPAWYRLPESRDLAAQLLLVYQLSVPFGLDVNDTIAVDGSASRLTVTLENLDNASLEALAARADGWLRANAPPAMQTRAVGTPLVFALLAKRNIRSMLEGTAWALLLIAAVLVVTLRDLPMGLLSLVPNVVPAVLAYGVWALAVGELGLALSVVTAMTLGVVVDDTVHFLSSYLDARRRLGASAERAVEHAFAHVGQALVATSAILIAGFAVLSTSSYAINQGLGRMTALIIAIALVADLSLLPALLLALARRRGE